MLLLRPNNVFECGPNRSYFQLLLSFVLANKRTAQDQDERSLSGRMYVTRMPGSRSSIILSTRPPVSFTISRGNLIRSASHSADVGTFHASDVSSRGNELIVTTPRHLNFAAGDRSDCQQCSTTNHVMCATHNFTTCPRCLRPPVIADSQLRRLISSQNQRISFNLFFKNVHTLQVGESRCLR